MLFSLILCLNLAIQPFLLQGFFSLLGTVRDETGQPVPSVRLSLVDENYAPIRTVFADGSGRFQFPRLRAGSYYLRVEPTGTPFEEQSIQVDLQSLTRRASTTEEPTMVDVVLRRKKPRSPLRASSNVVFAQDVPPAACEEYNRGASSIRKNPETGMVALRKAIEIFPDYFDALELLGTEYVKNREFESATPILLKAIEINNEAYTSMFWLGTAFFKLNHLEESIRWLQKAAEGDSGNANIYMMLGLAYGNHRALNESETALKKAYQLGGANAADAHLYLAAIYSKQERYGEACQQLELYLKEAKDLKDTTLVKGLIARLRAKDRERQ